MKDVYPVDLEPYIDKRAPPVRGWSIKPLAMFFSRFQEFIFVDSDALFFRDPTTIFDWKRYNMTGAIYFRDRTLEPNNAKSLSMFKSMVPHASEYARNGRFSKLLSVHEGESGVVALDKHRGGTFILLLSLMMNMEPFKRIYYAAVHGRSSDCSSRSRSVNLDTHQS